ncbi:MAG: site-2 protease family protein [Planctomycetota bacterium]
MSWQIGLMLLPGLVVGLTIHEAAHALSAKWLGDRGPQKAGRITLNPFKHLSPLGTLALFVLGFGWGKPVVVNLYNFRKPKLYYLLSSLAGPASNLMLSAVALAVLYLRPPVLITYVFVSIFLVNVILAVVNLLPIPPLDGSKIWPCIIPGARPTVSSKWSKIWMAVLLVCLFTGAIGTVIRPVLNMLMSLLPPNLFNL